MVTLMPIDSTSNILCLLQLASPTLPVGAYSYSEGLETLVDAGTIENEQSLKHWLEQELRYGAIRLEAAVMVRAYRAAGLGDSEALGYWNAWASAARETEELRQQSWQMGQSLMRLLLKMHQVETRNRTSCRFADVAPCFANANVSLKSLASSVGNPCNFAIAFGLAAEYWQIDAPSALLGYLHSWASNFITNGVKLIPLGQTAGQQLLLELHGHLSCATEEILALRDDDLNSCSWGLALASMAHETQYTRLFRS